MFGILGKKIGMTQIFDAKGEIVAVTALQAGPCTVTEVRTPDNNGYASIQLSFDKDRFVREIRVADSEAAQYQKAQTLGPEVFQEGEFVDIIGTSIGKGFQGGMKRHHWAGGPASHGSMHHRAPGSIGASSFPSRSWKGQRLPGHMGNERATVQNLEVVKIDKDNNLLLVKGSVPGHKKSYLIIREAKKKSRQRLAAWRARPKAPSKAKKKDALKASKRKAAKKI